MSTIVFRDATIWLAEFDVSGDHREMSLELAADEKDETAFGDSTHIRASGTLKVVTFGASGFWEGGDGNIDDTLFDNIGAANKMLTCSADGGSDGETAYSFLSQLGEYVPGTEVGEVLPFTLSAGTMSNCVQGTILHPKTSRTSSSTGTARNLGAVGATQSLYAGLHVFSASGTLDVTIESDAADDFSGGETTRVTFAQATAATSEWATPVSGPITDTWFRINYTIGGGTPDFTFTVWAGIL